MDDKLGYVNISALFWEWYVHLLYICTFSAFLINYLKSWMIYKIINRWIFFKCFLFIFWTEPWYLWYLFFTTINISPPNKQWVGLKQDSKRHRNWPLLQGMTRNNFIEIFLKIRLVILLQNVLCINAMCTALYLATQ